MKKSTLRLLVLLTPFVTGLLLGFFVGNCSGRHHALRSSLSPAFTTKPGKPQACSGKLPDVVYR